MATLAELAGFKHHAVRSDGAKFLDGVRNDNLDTSWLTVNNGLVTLRKGLYDELLVVKGEVTDDQIKTWAAMQSPFYDPAGNIVFEGAGGRIEMDKYGQRFIRASDNKTMIEFDTETGDATFKGDITGASGTFTGPVKSIDVEGNYSLLDEARLRFYRRIGDEDVLSYYVAQIATGQALNGEVVDLGSLGYRFFEPPKVVLQPKSNRVFVANMANRDVWMDWGVEDETFNPITGEATFKVRCRTIVKGGISSGSFSPSRLETSGTSTTSTTSPGTTSLDFTFKGFARGPTILSTAKLVFTIYYRKMGASIWTHLDTQTFTGSVTLDITKTLTYTVPDSGEVGYQVRVDLTELSDTHPEPHLTKPHLTVSQFSYRSGDTILNDPNNPEIVSWIAIDGG